MHDAQRWFNRPLAVTTLAMTLAGCGGEADTQDRDLYDEAIAGDAYKSWQQFPGASPDLIASGLHNGDFVRSYMNDVAVAAIASFDGSFPDGTILVKEQYEDAEGKVSTGHTVMLKIDGYDSAHGDWYWVAYDAKGETTTHNGMAPYCSNCHEAAAATNDWVYTSFK
ncbi:cytochrome P460 family protein [Amaricoccus sp.]|jgi:hypothetical protein|uniref:cytochrome P460 family protein n=1 Tax=Amaricoccus sp. TaxID=1872485 RepID=UPI001B403E14|nr:cytochrome P460 family protein [Amaricoccus sp.]MBP7003777.1 cytochrome P460 family protein [Amaricoccus sp.]